MLSRRGTMWREGDGDRGLRRIFKFGEANYLICILVLLALAGLPVHSSGQGGFNSALPPRSNDLEKEYNQLYDVTEEKEALESIRSLHQQLDDDKDGAIEPSETQDFIRDDLRQNSKQRHNRFHHKDAEITVKDLWVSWRRSEVYNWTTDQVADWLSHNVELPQYADHFRRVGVNGTMLPKAAVSNSYLSKVVGVNNPIHRSKIGLKAMDVVLFGAPRDHSNLTKDIVLSTLLVLAITLLFYAYRQNKRSQQHLKKMMSDMDGLAKAEKELQELQAKMGGGHWATASSTAGSSTPSEPADPGEMSRLKEELEQTRHELQRAEDQLMERCFTAPATLQTWLQLTYELETQVYDAKMRQAEEQMELAKEMCERLKKKRSSLVGAFVSTHGSSIDNVDRSILEAKQALLEMTEHLQERTLRWKQIELVCGWNIVKNPGLNTIKQRIKHVGHGQQQRHSTSREELAGITAAVGQGGEDLTDTHSVAASSTHMSHASRLGGGGNGNGRGSVASRHRRQHLQNMSRESSKESSSSDEMTGSAGATREHSSSDLKHVASANLRLATAASQNKTGSPSTVSKRAIGKLMKSPSQDSGGSIQSAASNNGWIIGGGGAPPANRGVSASISEEQLSIKSGVSNEAGSVCGPAASISGSVQGGLHMNHHLSVPGRLSEESDNLSQLDMSDSSSMTDLTSVEKKEKKRRMFFNFRRKKEKKEMI